MARSRRQLNVFSLSFLDAMTCGFGAVVLFFMIINGTVGLRASDVTNDLTAEVDRLEREVLEGTEGLVELRNAIRAIDESAVEAQGLSTRIIDQIVKARVELATFDQTNLSQREHVNKLMADLKSLEEGAKRLSARAESEEVPGDRPRSFVGDGDRQYLTGLKVGGSHILILMDASASMLAEDIVNIIRRRNLPEKTRIRAEKWQQAVRTVDWLTTQLPTESKFQIFKFNESAGPVLADTAGQWLDGGDSKQLDLAVAEVRAVVPKGGTSLYHAFRAAQTLSPRPDNVILLTDGLPTRGRAEPKRSMVTGRQRLKLFNQAVSELPTRVPVNLILFPMEGDPLAAAAFWKLALDTRGSFLSPPEDWP